LRHDVTFDFDRESLRRIDRRVIKLCVRFERNRPIRESVIVI